MLERDKYLQTVRQKLVAIKNQNGFERHFFDTPNYTPWFPKTSYFILFYFDSYKK